MDLDVELSSRPVRFKNAFLVVMAIQDVEEVVNDVYTSKITNKEIMSSIIIIDSKSPASEAVDLMLRNNIRHLIVVDERHTNKPVGMITPLDLRDEEYSEACHRRIIGIL